MTTSILLTTDGTYPCYRGGVSVWCDQLIRQLPQARFHVFALTYSPSDTPLFTRHENVATQDILPLWGTVDPGPQPAGLIATLQRRLQTTSERIRSGFLPHFEATLRCILNSGDPEHLAKLLLALHLYFMEYDYSLSVTSKEAWETFLRVSRGQGIAFSLDEATTCMRWLQRYLAVTAVQLPETEIVHASMAGLAGIPGVLQKLLHGSAFVLTEHGIYLRELYLSLAQMNVTALSRKFLFQWFESIVRMNYHYADQITSLCEFNRRWQIRMGAESHTIKILPNGINPSRFSPRVEPRKNGPPVVVTMARIYRLKGIDHLLRAIRLVLDVVPDVRWRILGEVGDMEYAYDCMRLAEELGIMGNIEWGQTDDAPTAYREADVFCLPSISEGMPFSVLEAMFSGCPVVATDVGGVAEMLQGTGLVVAPRDPQALARALLCLLAGEEAAAFRQDLAARALVRASSHYDIQQFTKLIWETYGQLSRHTRTSQMSAA